MAYKQFTAADKIAFDRDGYVIIKNFFQLKR